jgi:ABC-type protease/lipase transport system fused ATPase/permease subunit
MDEAEAESRNLRDIDHSRFARAMSKAIRTRWRDYNAKSLRLQHRAAARAGRSRRISWTINGR